MESLEDRLKRIEYYQQLLLDMLDSHQYPVYELIIRRKLAKHEVEELFSLCEDLLKRYEEQEEAGLIHFDSLLTQFVGMLNMKLNPGETIEAFYLQNMYRPLMEILMKCIKNYEVD